MKDNLEELANWNSTAGVCQLWEKQNPLLIDGVGISIKENFKLESKLQNEYELLCMKHTSIGIKILVMVIIATIATAIVASGWWVVAVVSACFVISMLWINHMNKTQTAIQNKITKHVSQIIKFNVYVSELSKILKIDIKDLFVYPAEQLKSKAENILRDVARDIVGHFIAGDINAEAEDRKWLNFRYDLFISGGLIKPGTYGDHFLHPTLVVNN